MEEERKCLWCWRDLERNVDEHGQNWERRQYCNKSHAAKHSQEMKPRRR